MHDDFAAEGVQEIYFTGEFLQFITLKFKCKHNICLAIVNNLVYSSTSYMDLFSYYFCSFQFFTDRYLSCESQRLTEV